MKLAIEFAALGKSAMSEQALAQLRLQAELLERRGTPGLTLAQMQQIDAQVAPARSERVHAVSASSAPVQCVHARRPHARMDLRTHARRRTLTRVQVLAIETEITGRAAQPPGRPQGSSAVQYDPAARYDVNV